MENTRTVIKCKDCNKPFTLTEEHLQWYKDKGLEPPKRCAECRKKRREAAKYKSEEA